MRKLYLNIKKMIFFLLVVVTSEEPHSLPVADKTYLKMELITGYKYIRYCPGPTCSKGG